VYQEAFASLEEAVRRERQLKGWSHAKKQALISGDRAWLKDLSKCRSTTPD
jgi:putative endonuclease